MSTQLMLDALKQTIWTRQREDHNLSGLAHHSNTGSQYTSIALTQQLPPTEIAASVGSSHDNA